MRNIQWYGYRPDLGDPRDHRYERANAPRPRSVDLRPHFPPCWNQGELGSCTAFALTGAMAFLHPGFEGSQLWLYYQERAMEGTTDQDAGAEIRDGIKVLAQLGLPPEKDWPYRIAKFKTQPPAKSAADAKGDLISSYQRLAGEADYLDCLAGGSPFVVGITVFESFESDEVARTGAVPMPGKREKAAGGHAICVVGYTEAGDYIVRNSWATDWGMNGYFTLPREYLASADLATDAWVVRK